VSDGTLQVLERGDASKMSMVVGVTHPLLVEGHPPMRKRAYRSVSVKDVKVVEVVSQLAPGKIWAGVDVAKQEVRVVVRDSQGEWQRPWSVEQPRGIPQLIEVLKGLSPGRELVVAMESTGTYGDALRQALSDAKIAVHRVSSKAASDHAETFDGVPSQHDGKDAAIVAELASMGKSKPWPYEPPSAEEGELQGEVQWLDTQQDILQLWLGRLEGLLARHWPEIAALLPLKSRTLRRILEEYGGPEALAADPEAAKKLGSWGGPFLKQAKIERILESARTTLGVRMIEAERKLMQRFAGQAREAQREIQVTKKVLERAADRDELLKRMARAVGRVTACVLFVTLGDPREFTCGPAYRKGLGINLKERSSGTFKGHLKITKRGPSLARKWLYFSALRAVQSTPIANWYQRKKSRDQNRGGKGLVAVMRKLALAVYAVATRNEEFDPARLFPGRPGPRVADSRSSPQPTVSRS
jgi:transposase